MLYKFFLADLMMIAIYMAFYSLIPSTGQSMEGDHILSWKYYEEIYNRECISQKEIFVHFYHILIYEMKYEHSLASILKKLESILMGIQYNTKSAKKHYS